MTRKIHTKRKNDTDDICSDTDNQNYDVLYSFADDNNVRNNVKEEANSKDTKFPPGPLFPWMPTFPLWFLGLGVYRAWIELTFVGSFIAFPAAEIAGQDAFDLTMIATLFGCAALSKRIGLFFHRKIIYFLAGFSLVMSTACMFTSFVVPSYLVFLGIPAFILGGFGIALIILLWSELYSCINPFRVALYYSASMIAAALIVDMSRGLSLGWLSGVVITLPVVSLVWVAAAFRTLPLAELPHTHPIKSSFPFKIVLLMAVYAFAYGLKESSMYLSDFGPHSAPGTVVVAAAVFLGVIARRGKFDFAIIYRIALPLMVAAFLILPNVGILNQAMSNFCSSASYTAFSILIMLVVANLSYRYGVSAIWLFGIERGVRALFSLLGRQTETLLKSSLLDFSTADTIISGLVIIAVVVATMILFSEKELSSRWGMVFLNQEEFHNNTPVMRKSELARQCQELARKYNLSPREEEVLLLLAQHKTIGLIERELFIANGTAKTHIRHIYKKLDIHSRDELIEKIDFYQ